MLCVGCGRGGGADARRIVSFGARDGKLLSQKHMFP
jgi:hypothetical protein